MGNLLNKNQKEEKITAEESTILQCKISRDNIKNYIKRLEKNSNLKREKAKEALKEKKKDRAKYNLKLSKMYKEQIKTAESQLTLLEEQINNIESAISQKEALKILEKGNEVLKNLQKECNIEKWEKISDDMNDLKEQQNEINQFFKDRNLDDIDDDIENEMNKLMENNIENELPKANDNNIVVDEKKEEYKIEDVV
jgi:hypothetical protein